MQVIAIATQKGGTGKTTTAAALASCIRRKWGRVLLIDLDQQRNLSRMLEAETTTAGRTSLALLLQAANAGEIIQHTEQGDIIAAGKNLQAADIALKDTTGKEYLLKEALAGLKGSYGPLPMLLSSLPKLQVLAWTEWTI